MAQERMADDNTERAGMPPMRAARPKSVDAPPLSQGSTPPPLGQASHENLREALQASVDAEAQAPQRRPRLELPEPLNAIRAIARTLQPYDREVRRKIIDTVSDLT